MSVSRKITYNVVVSSVLKILGTVLALVGMSFVTRYLGKDGYGLYSLALAYFLFFNSFGDWGIYQTLTRKISRPKTNEKKIVENIAGLRLIVSVLVVVLAPIIAHLLPHPKELKVAIIIVSFAFLFSSSTQFFIGMFQKRIMMDKVTMIEFFGKIIQVTLIIVGTTLDLGFIFIVSSLLVTMIFNFFVVLFISRKFIKFIPKINPAYWKKFLVQSAPLGLSTIVTFIYFKADSFVLNFFHSEGAVGTYNAAYKVIENLSFFPGMIVGLTMPIFAYNIFSNRKKFELVANKNFKIFLILVVPLVIGTLFLAEGIINVIAGEEFSESILVLRIIIFSASFIFFGALFNGILIAAKLQKELFWALLFCAVFNLTLNFIFIPKYSYLATSFISVATEFLVAFLGATIIFKKLKFVPKTDGLVAIFVSGGILGAYLWFAHNFPPAIFENLNPNYYFGILVATSPIVYFGSLVLNKGITKEEIALLIKK